MPDFSKLDRPALHALVREMVFDRAAGVTVEQLAQIEQAAFKRGAEAMRAAAIEVASKRANLPATSDFDAGWCRSAQCIVDELRDLTVSEDKS